MDDGYPYRLKNSELNVKKSITILCIRPNVLPVFLASSRFSGNFGFCDIFFFISAMHFNDVLFECGNK